MAVALRQQVKAAATMPPSAEAASEKNLLKVSKSKHFIIYTRVKGRITSEVFSIKIVNYYWSNSDVILVPSFEMPAFSIPSLSHFVIYFDCTICNISAL